jgi:hypothetical protein
VGALEGIAMDGLPEFQLKTDENGFYSSTVGHGWSGTVTPVDYSDTLRFDPPNRVYSNVTSDQTNQDYTPILVHTITGQVRDPELGWAGIQGVTMSGLPRNPVTNSQGSYYDKVDDGWSGTVIPTKNGCTFEPASIEYVNVTETLWNQNYSGSCGPWAIASLVRLVKDCHTEHDYLKANCRVRSDPFFWECPHLVVAPFSQRLPEMFVNAIIGNCLKALEFRVF